MATEIATFKVKESFSPNDMQRALEFLKPLPKGLQSYRWSRSIIEPNTIVFFLNWDSVADHWDFVKNSPAYPPFREIIDSILAEPTELSIYHTHLQPFLPAKIFEAPYIGLRSVAKRPEISREKFEATIKEITDDLSKAPGFQSQFHGVQHEDDTVYIVLLIWDTFESHTGYLASRPDLKAKILANIVPEKSAFHELKLYPQ